MRTQSLEVYVGNIIPRTYEAQIDGLSQVPTPWGPTRLSDFECAVRRQMNLLADKWRGLSEGSIVVMPCLEPCNIVVRWLGLHNVEGDMRHQIDDPDNELLKASVRPANVYFVWMVFPPVAYGELHASQKPPHYSRGRRIVWKLCLEDKEIDYPKLRKGTNHEFKRWWVDVLKCVGVRDISQSRLPSSDQIVALLTPPVRESLTNLLRTHL